MHFTAYCLSAVAAAAVVTAVPLQPARTVTSKKPIASAASAMAFTADPAINIAGIYAAAKSSNNIIASYPTTSSRKNISHIYGDWQNFAEVSAFHFIADMDIDCDGPRSNCKGNNDGQTVTSFGALDATKVPYFVLPEKFTTQNKDILKDNALGAIICDGKMFYGIYGDQDSDSPQVIGEASILIGQSCFPGANISGGNGHADVDVAYIIFGSQVPTGVQKTSIDMAALKRLGDTQVKLLEKALNL
ncbi:fungal chitosanase of glycosyl hydrolase group 75-domain-containing protein [Mycena rebaudengoi]|nr:fungal chitosanase of glycosyl hydrolase group 75-domain-containing protein [Mycena rebaudengoi]